MGIKHELRRALWRFGYDISKFTPESHSIARRRQIFSAYKIDTVLDIGANAGQFSKQLRSDINFKGKILSFEPLSSAFGLLRESAKNDPSWEVFNFGMGESVEKREINIAGNSLSSSLLGMLPAHERSAPSSKYIGKEVVDIRTVDSVVESFCRAAKNIYMKIDTQGFESQVLRGADKSLARIDTIQMEMSLVPLYDGELLFNEMCMHMCTKGYSLIAIETGFTDEASGQLLQADGIFHRL